MAFQPASLFACAACYGASDSPMAKGMNWGIFSLLGVVDHGAGQRCHLLCFYRKKSRGGCQRAAGREFHAKTEPTQKSLTMGNLFESLRNGTEKLLGLPVLASEHGRDVDSLIIYVHWLMIALFVGWLGLFRLRAVPLPSHRAIPRPTISASATTLRITSKSSSRSSKRSSCCSSPFRCGPRPWTSFPRKKIPR